MELRCRGWSFLAPVAACFVAAGVVAAPAMDAGSAGLTSGPSGAKLMWGGPVPKAPVPGQPSVYVPSQSAYAPSRPSLQPPIEEAAPPEAAFEEVEPLEEQGEAVMEAEPEPEDAPEGAAADLGTEDSGVALYAPILPDAMPDAPEGATPYASPQEATLAPLGDPVEIDGGEPAGLAEPREDPWAGLTEVTPGAVAPPRERGRLERLERRARPSYAELQGMAPPRRITGPADLPGRGALEAETPSGYQPMPAAELQCRRQLAKLGVRFVDATSIRRSRSCGIDNPVKITEIAEGIAMKPAATLNCAAALRVAQWMRDEVQPAARWKLLKRPTAVINASSYRCSRIAGSRSISEHASGNALDVAGFKFADGSVMAVEKKGFFDFREKSFQTAVRQSACRYFGTVLGPGYNRAHRDHLHLDAKQRRRTVCK